MPENNQQLTTNSAWSVLIEEYNILAQVKENGYAKILADQIKKYREPRLMAKWDSSDSLPKALKEKNLNILPVSRKEYIVGDFILYEKIPELDEPVTLMDSVEIPHFESIDVDNISSEASAINVMKITGILDDFLEIDNNVSTFNGRMGTGCFDFVVDRFNGTQAHVEVHDAQCEIDGGYENHESIVILEAKNVVHEDFHIRQLYYPYRLWLSRVNKPIRLVFSVYSNKIYRLFEYKFSDYKNYSSIELVKTKNYSLQDTTITIDELIDVRNNTQIIFNDKNTDIPFIQADSFNRVISLLENLYNNPMTSVQIAELMDFDSRQSDYYYNAGRYLGLFEKKQTDDRQIVVDLTKLGKEIFKLNYKERQLKLVRLMLQHEIFAQCFDEMIKTTMIPSKEYIKNCISLLGILGKPETINRRASSVLSWLKWILDLTKL